jgi:CHAT domain-containing protein/tetratricopeptide (TPR) repeat protein
MIDDNPRIWHLASNVGAPSMTFRRSLHPVGRLIALATVLALASLHPLDAQTRNERSTAPPSAPARVTGKSASRLDELDRQIDRLQVAGRFSQALAPAREALQMRTKLQGAGHWETVAARRRSELLARLARLPADGRRATGTAYGEAAQAIDMDKKGQYREAEPLLRAQVEAFGRWLGEDHFETARAYDILGVNLFHQGRYADAVPLLQKALDVRRKAYGEEHPNTATSCNDLAICLSRQARYADALPLLRKALEIDRKAYGEEHPYTATAYNNLALNLTRQARHAEALPLLQKAVELLRKLHGEDHPSTATAYNNLALNLQNQGRYADALPLYQKALDIRRKTLGDQHPETAQARHNLAGLLDRQGRYAEAEPLLMEALTIHRVASGENHPETAAAYNSLALNLRHQERYADALPLFQKALDVRRTVLGEDHPDTATACSNLALDLDALGRHAEARPLLQKALDVRRRVLGESHPLTATAYNNLAVNLSLQGRPADALPLLQKALEIDRHACGEDHPDTALAYRNLAMNLMDLGRIPEAIRQGTAAAESFERSRRVLSSSGLGRSQAIGVDPLPALVTALASQGQAREAWRRWESSLGRGLLDDLSARQLRPLTPDQRGREEALLGQIQQLDERIGSLIARRGPGAQDRDVLDRLRRQRNTLNGQLVELEQAFEAQYGALGGQRASLEDVKAALPPDAALVGWVDVRGRNGRTSLHWACLVGPRGEPTWARVPGTGPAGAWTDQDDRRPGQLRAALRTRGPGWRELAEQLARQRLAPLDPQLGRVRRLIVLPSPDLAGVPIEVLLAAWSDRRPPSVSYAPSGTMFAQLVKGKADRSRATKLLAVGDPLYDQSPTNPVPRLPGTRREVLAIAALFPPTAATILLGAEATEGAVQRLAALGELADHRYLHFATHGSVDPAVAMSSALILGPDAGGRRPSAIAAAESDGRITAEQILNTWTLDADLVVFSACQTGLGRQAGGEGYLGFAQALFIKGARSLVLSQWNVSDVATALLMARFYRNLLGQRPGLSRPMPRAEALDEAKQWLRNLTQEEATRQLTAIQQDGAKEPPAVPNGPPATQPPPRPAPTGPRPFEHPQFWAPFILIGDAS